jgi:hypothetical protein
MGIVKRISLLIFGFISGMLGFISILVSIALVAASISEIEDFSGRIFMAIFLFVVCEVLLAFGIAASLLGLRCVLGPKGWILRIINYSWSKAVKFGLILPILGLGFAAIFKLLDFFFS